MRAWAIVLLLLLVIFAVAVGVGIYLFSMLDATPQVSQNSVLRMELGGTLSEFPSENPFELLLDPNAPSLYDYWRVLDYAASDRRISGIYLEIQPLSYSWAQLDELRAILTKFKEESGKPIHAFLALDMVNESELSLASVADSLTLNPDTMLLINGLMAEVTFYQRTLQKLSIAPQFFQFKEFKSPEVYDRTAMSQPIREMYESLLGDLQKNLIESIAKDRGVSSEKVMELIDNGMTTPQQAVAAGIIDEVGYRTQVFARLGVREAKTNSISASDYFRSIKSRIDSRARRQVALVDAVGIITSGNSDAFSGILGGSSLAGHLRAVRTSGRFAGVLLRVDSPGGSAVGSDMVWNEVRLLEEAGIPVVVSMSGVAGSGGYYIAMGASKIISQPNTITGSIGVIFGKFDIEGFYNWLGMDVDHVKLGPYADIVSPFTTLDEAQQTQVMTWMQEVYKNFVGKAAEGRGTGFEELEAKAKGRVYTGAQALELGLVDDLGGFDKALEHVRAAIGASPGEAIQLVRYPRPKTLWETLTADGFVRMASERQNLLKWLETELQTLATPAPRLLMPEARIY